MARAILTIALVAFAASSVRAFFGVPRVSISLDDPPEQRWIPAIDAVLARHAYENSIQPIFKTYDPMFAEMTLPNTSTILAAHIEKTHPDRYRELMGIANHLNKKANANVSVAHMALYFYFYELMHITEVPPPAPGLHASVEKQNNHRPGVELPPIWARACCGILSLPADINKPIIHGRNMDESPHDGRNCTLAIDVMKGGKRLYQIFDWTWLTTGFYNGQRYGGVSLEQNWRVTQLPLGLNDVLNRITEPGREPIAILFRRVLESHLDFEATVAYLAGPVAIAPMYIIMTGTARRGAVISVDYNVSRTVTELLNDTSSVTFMVQTNYDRWRPDPPADPRRTVAEQALTTVGRDRSGTELGVWMALSTYPVHNQDTMYSALMGAERPDVEGYIRMAMDPHQWN